MNSRHVPLLLIVTIHYNVALAGNERWFPAILLREADCIIKSSDKGGSMSSTGPADGVIGHLWP